MRKIIASFFILFCFFMFVGPALATTTGMPWESRLDGILDSISGPVARVFGAMAIIGCGLGIAFSDGGSGMRKALWVIFGLSIAFSAVSWGLGFLGFGGALTI